MGKKFTGWRDHVDHPEQERGPAQDCEPRVSSLEQIEQRLAKLCEQTHDVYARVEKLADRLFGTHPEKGDEPTGCENRVQHGIIDDIHDRITGQETLLKLVHAQLIRLERL